MKIAKSKGIGRREFIKKSSVAAWGFTIIPSWMVNGVRIPPSDRVVMGFIGLGRQGLSDFRGFAGCAGVEVAACCDVHETKVKRFVNRVNDWHKSHGVTKKCDGYEFLEDLLKRTDIDAVEVATPDHWHAFATIMACNSGKDVYCQKPLAYTINEGLSMVKAVRRNKRILQVGSQQRSGKEFQKAIELVQNGNIGHVEKVYARVGDPPADFNLPKESVPVELNWDQWLGGLNDGKIHYNPDLCPPISLDPPVNEKLWGAWRWYRETGNGYTSDWGAHMFDIAQAAIGMDGSGPVLFTPVGYQGSQYSQMRYANGIVMSQRPYLEDNETAQGIKFFGDKGWVEVARGYLACSDPSLIPKELAGKRPLSTAEIIKLRNSGKATNTFQGNAGNVAIEIKDDHKQNFIDSVRSRKDPVAPVEVGASTNTLCCLVNIAEELGRPVRWNPATRTFPNDTEAADHRLFSYPYKEHFTLKRLV